MSKASLIPLDFFLDLCPFDLYSKTGPSIPSCTPSIVPDVSMIHGMNITTNNPNLTTCMDSHSQLQLSYCPSTSLNIPCASEMSKSSPSLVPCALTQSSSTPSSQTILSLCKTINDYLDDITRLFVQIDTGSDRRMHQINLLLKQIQEIVERSLIIQEKLFKPLNDSSSDMLKLNMFIRSSHLPSNQQSFYLDHRLHQSFVQIFKQIVRLIDSSRLSSLTTTIDLQHQLDSIHEQTNLMHEHLVTITRKLEANIL